MPTQQNIGALARANECKTRRFKLGQEIRAGEVKLSELLARPVLPDWLEGESAERLLKRVPRLGARRVGTLLAELRIGPRRPVGELTYRQRRELSDHLAAEEGRWNRSGRRARLHFGSTAGSAKRQVSAGGGS